MTSNKIEKVIRARVVGTPDEDVLLVETNGDRRLILPISELYNVDNPKYIDTTKVNVSEDGLRITMGHYTFDSQLVMEHGHDIDSMLKKEMSSA